MLLLVLSAGAWCHSAFGQSGISGDQLLLQGFEPQIEFNDNDGTLQRWYLTGDDFGFIVEDLTASTSPFRIDIGVPNDALRVRKESTPGDVNVGIGGMPVEDVNLHIRENFEPVIRLHQTSSTGYIWDISASSSSFVVGDITAGTFPFMLDTGLPTSALRVINEAGDVNVGIGGSPTTDINLHIREASSPTIRLNQTSGAGYSWDLVANSGEFFLQDVTGNTFPFSVAKAAPSGSFRINTNGNTGLGTSSPMFPLHVVRTTGTASRIAQFTQTKAGGLMTVGYENDAPASTANEVGFDLVMKTTLQSRVASRISSSFANVADNVREGVLKFSLSTGGTGFEEVMRLKGSRVGIGQQNPTQLLQVGSATCNGSAWTNACSRQLKHDIVPLDPDAARAAVLALEPVTYAYNSDPTDPRVGFIAEDVPELLAEPGRDTLSSLDIVAALTSVVQQQETTIESQAERLAAQQAVIDGLTQRLEALERRVATDE